MSCGTEIIILNTGGDTWSATSGEVVESQVDFALDAVGGDQIIAFQGTIVSPKFLYAFHFANNDGWTDATDANSSAVPAGLTNGINAVAFNRDNSVYNYSVTTNQSLILSAIADNSNWSGNNGSRQTLGLPIGVFFTCSTPGVCFGTATWSGGSWFGTPDLSTNVIIATDYSTADIGAGNFSGCSLTVNAGVSLTVENNTFIIVENDVTINDGASLVVETQGSFVQNDDGGSMTILDSGTAILNKTTPEKQEWFYYTYWSSPVTVQTIGNMFPTVPSDWRYSFNAANFVDTNADDIDDDGNDWEIAADADTMIPGVGYAVAGERNSPGLYPREDIISFTGAFNTGNITVPITYGPANTGIRWNFIGNPYPSAIDFVAFHLANASVVEGAAYFWSQASPPDAVNPGNDAQNLNLNDYAIFTVGTGGAAGGSPIEPNGYIASGQGFFIPAQTSLTNPSGNSVTFTNAMRRADNTSNSQFFKGASSKQSKASAINPLENRLWLNLTTDNGVFNQILIGYVENATNDYDGMSYDAPKILNSELAAALYTSIENNDTKYAIQGKDINSITENEIIKLGFINVKVNEDKPFKLSIAKFEGAFLSDNAIYIKDNVLGTVHNLTETDYTFTSESGEFNDRFEIVFKADVLSMDENTLENNLLRIIDLNNDALEFRTSENLTIETVSVFDLLGRQLYDLKGNNNSETYKLSNLSNATYVVKVQLSNGAVITKKIIKK